FRDRPPGVAVIVAAKDADVRPRSAWPVPLGPAAVVLHVESARRALVACNLVNALAEFRVGIGHEAGADALVCCREGLAAVLAQVMPPGGDAKVHALAVAEDGVHAQSAVAGIPLASMLVVTDAGHHFPGIAAVAALEKRRRFDAAPEVLLVVARLKGPDI